MPTIQHLANELLLHVVSYLPLKSLVASRGVSKHWQELITTGAGASIHPARHELLNLYLTIVHSPYFLQTRSWVIANLQPFDREAYVDALLIQYPRLPVEFRLWILEWPARAVTKATWPGLPPEIECSHWGDDVGTFEGVNWLAAIPPVVYTLTCSLPDVESNLFDFVPAVLIRDGDRTIWLILDDSEEGKGILQLRDKVYTTPFGGTNLDDEGGMSEYDDVDLNWVAWQKRMWTKTEEAAKRGPVPLWPKGVVMTKDPTCHKGIEGQRLANTWVNRYNPGEFNIPLEYLYNRSKRSSIIDTKE